MRGWSKRGVLSLATAVMLAVGAPAVEAQAVSFSGVPDGGTGRDGAMLMGAEAAPDGVSSGAANPSLERRAKEAIRSNKQALSVRKTGEAKSGSEQGLYYCVPYIESQVAQVGFDDYLEETGHVDYYADVNCNFYLDSIEAIAGVFDRSDSFNGENFDGRVLGTGSYWYSEFDYFGASQGAIDISARAYNGGREVEPAFEMYLLGPIGFVWDECNPLVGLRYLACDGLGTDYLHVVVGTGDSCFAAAACAAATINSVATTGLAPPCRHKSALDAEQARIESGSPPAATQILKESRFRDLTKIVTDFKANVCKQTNATGVSNVARSEGQRLWDKAVDLSQGVADDRGLYWGRLQMTSMITRFSKFGIDKAGTKDTLERTSRGLDSTSFTKGTAKTVFISGFDPFFLTSTPFRGNPSGASVLRLDGQVVNGAEIQAVVFPVRYADFNNGLVERTVDPMLRGTNMVATVSQGADSLFDLEVYNGLRRSSGSITDNLNVTGGGDLNNPAIPPGLGTGATPEFARTTLPVGTMAVSGKAQVNSVCREKVTASALPTPCPGTGPTTGSIAVEGSGGGYLSNEIAYRVTRLRDNVGASIPAGHIHTRFATAATGPGDPGFGSYAGDLRDILSAGIGTL